MGPLPGVFGQALRDGILHDQGDGVLDAQFRQALGHGLRRPVANLREHLAFVEGRRAREQVVDGRAQAIHVVEHGGLFAQRLLRAQEAQDVGGGLQIGRAGYALETARDAEVGQLELFA